MRLADGLILGQIGFGLPTPDRRLTLARLSLDRHRANPVGAQQHDPSPPDMLLWAVSRPDHGLQPLAVARAKPDLYTSFHSARLAQTQAQRNHSSAPIH